MSGPLPIGIIGCGRITERYYLPAIARLPAAHLVAVADPRSERRGLVTSRVVGCVAYPSAEALLAEAQVAALIVATPTATHVAVATLALCAGLPVLIEKPLASSMAEAEPLHAVATAGTVVMVGFNRRFWDPVHRLRERIRHSDGLRKVSVQLVMTADMRAWDPVSERSDPLDDLGSHQVDLLRFLFDREVDTISARWTDLKTIHMRVVLSGGITGDCVAAHTGVPQESITVRCNGRVYCVRRGSERITPAPGPVRAVLDAVGTLSRRLWGRRSSLRRSYERQLSYFLHCVRTGAAPQPGLADGIAAIRALEAARRSASSATRGGDIT